MKHSRFVTYSYGLLAYTMIVIMWGAFVRATGSGAGCGSHWPLCNGTILPRPERIETLIEFSHRVTSGLLGFSMLLLAGWAFRAFPRGHRVRYSALATLACTVTEGLIGGAQVRFEMVAGNTSPARAIWQSAHLANTFVLLGALALTVWWAVGGRAIRLRGQGLIGGLLGVGLLGAIILGITGTVAALGDTLFPVNSLAEGFRQDFSSAAHFLERLRVIHPAFAVALGIYLVVVGGFVRSRRPSPGTTRCARMLAVLFVVQLGLGALNVVLLAPTWMQLVHLLMADLVWITLVLLAASALAVPDQAIHGAPVLTTVPYAEQQRA